MCKRCWKVCVCCDIGFNSYGLDYSWEIWNEKGEVWIVWWVWDLSIFSKMKLWWFG